LSTINYRREGVQNGSKSEDLPNKLIVFQLSGIKAKNQCMFQLTGYRFFTLQLALLFAGCLFAIVPDTTRVYGIREVTVTGNVHKSSVRSSAPLNVITSDQIEKLNALQVSDAVKFFPGVTVRDYGGVGGLKTVSVRSLGASHTAVSYDGITLSDVQTGQIDIGRFTLENVEMISLNNGQSDNIFQPARSFASASLLTIRTKAPVFEGDKKYNTQISLRSGSFGLFNPSFLYQQQFGTRLSVSFSGEWLNSHGEYPYLLEHSYSGNGMSSSEIRRNTDVENVRLESSAYFKLSESENAQLKAYFYHAERGLPGATILYNTENFSSQRLWDQTFFSQAFYEKKFSQQWSAQLNAKFNTANLHYLDSTYLNDVGMMESKYRQEEYYLSAATLFRPAPQWMFSWSSDGFINHMDAAFETPELTDAFAKPTRYNLLNVLAVKYVAERITATSSVLSTLVKDVVIAGPAGESYNKWSPYLSFSYQPFKSQDLRLRAFYKHVFRLPTFNDLYYARTGNADLKPETTYQWNGGVSWSAKSSTLLPLLMITADVYKNKVLDKIIAMPSKNIFIWSMTNLGIVDVTGYDISAEGKIRLSEEVNLSLMSAYTWQKAIDITDPEGRTYGHQIPYTPRISGSGRIMLETKPVNLAYTFLWSGKRYAGYQNYAEFRLPGYDDHGISVYKSLKIKDLKVNVKAEMLNIFNKQYAVVKWFPMPGRSFRFTAGIHL
jgi:outer membrane cobalamin receptor